MLRTALGVSWKDRVKNEMLYGNLPKVSETIRRRRLKLAGHCYRHPEEAASGLVLWEPKHGKRKRGRPALTYIDQLCRETDLTPGEMTTCMLNRELWRFIQVEARAPT